MLLNAQMSSLQPLAGRQAVSPACMVPRPFLGRQVPSPHRQQRQRQPVQLASQRHVVCMAQAAQAGTEITKVEIPSFIPRQDLMDQLTRWAYGNAQDDGLANFGLPMRVNAHANEAGAADAFTVEIVRGGTTVTSIGIGYDEEITDKYEYVGRGEDGFPRLGGKVTKVPGKNLTVRKLDDNKVDEELRAAIKSFCLGLNSALNKYYAFGSCFSEDST